MFNEKETYKSVYDQKIRQKDEYRIEDTKIEVEFPVGSST